MAEKSNRGFAAMDPAKQKEIASRGGRAAHAKGTAHEFSPDEARKAGKKGGQAVSRDRDHMAEIGRQGGEAVSKDRAHMSRIGREGGEARSGRTPATRGADAPAETPEASSDENSAERPSHAAE